MDAEPVVRALRSQPLQPARVGRWSVEAEGVETDRVGLQAGRLRFERDEPSAAAPRTVGRRLAERVTYLLDPLEVVEAEEDRALVRSRPLTGTAAEHDYYDLWVTPDSLSVARFHGKAGQARESRPLSLTWEQVERLAADVESAFGNEA